MKNDQTKKIIEHDRKNQQFIEKMHGLDTQKATYEIRSESTWLYLKATIMRDMKIWSRYKALLIGGFVEFTILLGVFGFLSTLLTFRNRNLVTDNSLSETQIMFLFYLGGFLLLTFNNSALWTPASTVRRDLYNGTLEYVFITPVSRITYFLSTIIADMIIRFIYYFPILVVIIIFGKLPLVQLGYLLLVTVLALFSYMAIGLIIGVGALQWKNVNQLANLLGNLFNFVAGAFVPVALFPSQVKWVIYVFPQTYALDLIRFYSFKGAWVTVLPVFWEWVILLVFGSGLFTLGVILLHFTEKRVKRTGLNLI